MCCLAVMSSGMNLDVATKALAEGACYFLHKPISKDDLKYVWQHVYRRNRNIAKQAHKATLIEKAKSGKESVDIQIADVVVLSQSAAAVNYNNNCCINYQPMNYKEKEKIESHDSPVRSDFVGKRLTDDIEGMNREKRVKCYSEPTKFGCTTIDEDHERRKKYYISSDCRSRAVWNAERRQKFTDALNKLGDKCNFTFLSSYFVLKSLILLNAYHFLTVQFGFEFDDAILIILVMFSPILKHVQNLY